MLTLLLLWALSVPQATPRQTDTTFAVRSGGSLHLDNHQGSVRLHSWDNDRVRIAANHSSRVRVDVRRSGNLVRVESEARQGGPGRVDYDITVPRSFAVQVDGVYCEVLAEEIEGDLRVENVQGDIVIRGVRGDLDLESVDGEITVSRVRGRVVAETVNQSVRINGVAGVVDTETVNGSIQLVGVESDSVSAESVNGNIQFQGEFRLGGRYSFGTHNGSIQVVVPEGTNARVSIATHDGNVETEFPVQLRQSTGGGRLTFVLGNGSARIDVESFSGTIRLIRPVGRSP